MELLQPKGVRDFPPEEKLLRDKVLALLKEQFELYGFNPLETPVLERYEVLAAKYAGGGEILKETFRLTDQGERELGLRYDLTVPLARYVAMNPNLKLPFKRYAIGTVYRDGPIKLGRYREFYQCDCDIIGANSATADAQCMQLCLAVLRRMQFSFQLLFNHIGLLRSMLQHDGAPADKLDEAMLILDKLRKVGEEEITKELERAAIPAHCVKQVIAIAQLATNAEKLQAISEAYGTVPELARVQQLLTLLPETEVIFDPALSRGLAYYTGVVYEAFLLDSPIQGSVAGGGRYDKMIGAFLDRPDEYPAVGISFGLEPITEALKLRKEERPKSVVQVFVIPIRTQAESAQLTKELRDCGIRADMDLLERNISKNMDYANAQAIPYVVIVGPRELSQGQYKLKDMRTGEETLRTKAELLEELRQRAA